MAGIMFATIPFAVVSITLVIERSFSFFTGYAVNRNNWMRTIEIVSTSPKMEKYVFMLIDAGPSVFTRCLTN
jgi:hypothetical protein